MNQLLRKVDVNPIKGKSRTTNEETLNKLLLYKQNRRQYRNKSLRHIHNKTGLSIRSIKRLKYVEKYGSKITIDHIYSGRITLNYAEEYIQSVLRRAKEKLKLIKESEESGIIIVKDETTGEDVPLEYYNARKIYWDQLIAIRENNFKYVKKSSVINNLENMLDLIKGEEEIM